MVKQKGGALLKKGKTSGGKTDPRKAFLSYIKGDLNKMFQKDGISKVFTITKFKDIPPMPKHRKPAVVCEISAYRK